MTNTLQNPTETENAPDTKFDATFDAVVVGAGFGGMYMLHKLREAGFSARAYDTAEGVGGTWYWNRYPGCRCDVESMQYSYSFSDELQQEWNWSERYSSQSEILAYANHVADRFDLRRDIQFETRIDQAIYDDATHRWVIKTNKGQTISARYFITAVGCLSVANMPNFEGQDDFKGNIYHTGQWPHEGVDFTGRRVGVIGTGSSGVQSIPIIADQAKSLHVFQRTPNFVVPAGNRPLGDGERDAIKADYANLRAEGKQRPTGFSFPYNSFSALDVDEEERQKQYEEYWANGGLTFLGVFNDLLINAESNETGAEFVRKKVHQMVKDPKVAELLAPHDILGCKRLCANTGYYETFDKPHVKLVDISKTPISRFTAKGLTVGDTEYEFDDIVCATGFDAMTGALLKMDIRGIGGRTLGDKWEHGPRNYLGLSTKDFPNMFTITGPGSPSVFANMILGVEQHSEWIVACMNHMRSNELTQIEATLDAENAWVDHNQEIGEQSLRSKCLSWYLGSNVPGKPKVFSPYIGGYPLYAEKLKETVDAGYKGFVLSS